MQLYIFFIATIFLLYTDGLPIIFNRIKQSCDDDDECSKKKEVSSKKCEYNENFVGSNLFDGYRKICFSLEDVNLLIARRDFELMIPKDLPQELLDDKSVGNIMRYFYYGLWHLRQIENCQMRRTMEKAFYDTLGGFLHYYLIPVCKFSYYASKIELRTVRSVIALEQKCRLFLNTNGNGWRPPLQDPSSELANAKIEPLKFGKDEALCEEGRRYCAELDLTTATNGVEISDDNMIVALPKLELEDNEGYLNNIWLPFARKRTYNLRSCKSAFVFVKFYRTVMKCYKQRSMDRKTFDNKFRQWIVENIKVHLCDDVFYPGLGGILNIYESLRAHCTKANASATSRNDDDDNELKSDNEINEAERLVEDNSCSYANEIKEDATILKRSASYDSDISELNFIKEFESSQDAEDKGINDWIQQFDDVAMQDYKAKKLIKTKCKPKCKTFQTNTIEVKPATECRPVYVTTTPRPKIFTTAKRPFKPIVQKTKKPSKPMNADQKAEMCIYVSGAIFAALLLLLAILLFILYRRHGENIKNAIGELFQKLKGGQPSKKSKKASKASKTSKKASSKSSTASKKKDAKKGKKTAKKDKKADKKDKKAGKKDKKAGKKDKKADKKDKKKSDKKKEKAAKKDKKKSPKAKRKGGGATDSENTRKKILKPAREARPFAGLVSLPKRSRQRRGGRFHSRSPSLTTSQSRTRSSSAN